MLEVILLVEDIFFLVLLALLVNSQSVDWSSEFVTATCCQVGEKTREVLSIF
jgi:hypothetical protein